MTSSGESPRGSHLVPSVDGLLFLGPSRFGGIRAAGFDGIRLGDEDAAGFSRRYLGSTQSQPTDRACPLMHRASCEY